MMSQAIRVYTKSKRPKAAGVMVGVRLQPDQLAQLDAWIARLPRPAPGRPEAIRRLVEIGLERQSTTKDETE